MTPYLGANWIYGNLTGTLNTEKELLQRRIYFKVDLGRGATLKSIALRGAFCLLTQRIVALRASG